MVEGFEKVLTPELRAQAAARGLSVRELVTLASLVEKETGKAEERPLVAGVYCEPAEDRHGAAVRSDRHLRARARAAATTATSRATICRSTRPTTPTATPACRPGPIAAPGRASLEAAANPANVPYLYFVSRNDGSHVFAATLDEHNRNVVEFQKNRTAR